MRPTVLIIEARREVAAALEAVIETVKLHGDGSYLNLEQLSDLAVTPAAILVRIAFEASAIRRTRRSGDSRVRGRPWSPSRGRKMSSPKPGS